MARGQFSIFGAVEENVGPGFRESTGMENLAEETAPSRALGGVRVAEQREGTNPLESRGGLCTEGAQEMQKGSGR